jgi:hypothetical protein
LSLTLCFQKLLRLREAVDHAKKFRAVLMIAIATATEVTEQTRRVLVGFSNRLGVLEKVMGMFGVKFVANCD